MPLDRGARPLVFASHVREDKAEIRPFLERMLAAGIDLFVDRPEEIWTDIATLRALNVRAIRCGEDWNDEIRDALQDADRVVVFLSRHYLRKHDAGKPQILLREVEYAKQERKYLPVLIDDFADIKDQKEHLLRHFRGGQVQNVAVPLDNDPAKQLKAEHPGFANLIAGLLAAGGAVARATSTEPRRDLGLLPRLIDRREQEIDIQRALRIAARPVVAAAAPPMCFVAWGPRQEDFDALVRRLSRYTLRRDEYGKRARRAPEAQPVAVEWPPLESWLDAETTWQDYLDEMRRQLHWANVRSVDAPALARSLAAKVGAAVIVSRINLAMWPVLIEQGLLTQWVEHWTAVSNAFRPLVRLPDEEAADAGGALIALLCVETEPQMQLLPGTPARHERLGILKRLSPVTLEHFDQWWGVFQEQLAPAVTADFEPLFEADSAGARRLPMAAWVTGAERKLRERGIMK